MSKGAINSLSFLRVPLFVVFKGKPNGKKTIHPHIAPSETKILACAGDVQAGHSMGWDTRTNDMELKAQHALRNNIIPPFRQRPTFSRFSTRDVCPTASLENTASMDAIEYRMVDF